VTVQLGRPDTAPMARGRLMSACRRGELPAEVLDTADRDHLVYDFWAAGWSDVEIAIQTRMSTYTTGRIRARLGLAAHPSTRGAVA